MNSVIMNSVMLIILCTRCACQVKHDNKEDNLTLYEESKGRARHM